MVLYGVDESEESTDQYHQCPVCGRVFPRASELRHLAVHAHDKPFTCEQCGADFTHQCNLSRHILTHAKQQPLFTCDQCNTQFTHSNLQRHVRVHIGDKLFKCVLCLQELHRSSDLRSHMSVHTTYPV